MLFDHGSFDDHEMVSFVREPGSGLRAIVAVHSTAAGPACGGVRYWSYADDAAALTDVLRLARGMTYKNIMAGLSIGGGKAVVLAEPGRPKTRELFRALGRGIERLGGTYYGAEDVGVTTDDIAAMGEVTRYVAGSPRGPHASGDPSPFTARGVFLGLQAAAAWRLETEELKGVRVGILGLGAVGMRLAEHLHGAGASLVVADLDPARARTAQARLGARVVTPAELPFAEIDVFAPCALGSALTPAVIEGMRAVVVAGAANNQLASPECDRMLRQRKILYAPDYVINAGGIINVEGEVLGAYDEEAVAAKIARIPLTLEEIFGRGEQTNKPTGEVADAMAQARLESLRRGRRLAHAA